MPSVWSWYQSVVARWSLAYSKTAVPGSWSQPRLCLALKMSKYVPVRANPAGMLAAAGRNQASG